MRLVFISAAIASSLLLISGCTDVLSSEKKLTLTEACDADKKFCERIQADSRCRNERKDMIIARHHVVKDYDKTKAFDALIATEKFVACAELARHIEYMSVEERFSGADKKRNTPLTEKEKAAREQYAKSIATRKSQKGKNYQHALEELKRLEEWTNFSKIPELAFYQWSRHGDKAALERLIKADKEGLVNEAWLQYEISKHYSKISDEKTIHALNKSLVLLDSSQYGPKTDSPDDKKYNKFDDGGKFYFDTFRSLSTLHFSRENYAASYVFAQMLDINNDTTADLDFIMQYIEKRNRHKIGFLVDIAEELDDKLEDGEVTIDFLEKIARHNI